MMNKQQTTGWSLVEAVLAIAIFAIVALSLVSLAAGSLTPWLRQGEANQAEFLAMTGLEAARSIQARAWNDFVYTVSGLTMSSSTWQLLGEGTSDTTGQFSRQLLFASVCRDADGQVADCPAAKTDPHLKKITARITWPSGNPVNSLERSLYLANWSSRFWTQSDWSGGSGQAVWSADNKFFDSQNIDYAQTGEIKLAAQSGNCQPYTWTFDDPADYVFDPDLIEISNGSARLKGAYEYNFNPTPVADKRFSTIARGEPDWLKVADNVDLQLGEPVDLYVLGYAETTNVQARTMAITDDGRILQDNLDSLVLATGNFAQASLFPIAPAIFGLVYNNNSTNGAFIKTFQIMPNGTINDTVIDTYQFSVNRVYSVKVRSRGNNIYSLVFNSGTNRQGLIATLSISQAGFISKSFIDTFNLGNQIYYPDLSSVNNDVWAVNHINSNQRAYVSTLTIDSFGQIGNSLIDSFYVSNVSTGRPARLLKIGGFFLHAFRLATGLGKGQINSLAIEANGDIAASVSDSLPLANQTTAPYIVSAFDDYYVASFSYDTSFGDNAYLALFKADATTGQLSDSLINQITYRSQSGINSYQPLPISQLVYGVANVYGSTTATLTTFNMANVLKYPTMATIYAKNAYQPTQVDAWYGFSTQTTLNGGTVNYKIRDADNGNFSYWTGSAWTADNLDSTYNSSVLVDQMLPLFSPVNKALAFKAILQGDGNQAVAVDEVKVSCRNLRLEVGQVQADENWQTVNLQNQYVEPVVVAVGQAASNTLPMTVRIKDLSAKSFAVRLHNPLNADLLPDPVTYWVVEKGVWQLGGVKIEAGTNSTDKVGSSSNNWPYDNINFRCLNKWNLSSDPVVLHQVVTNNDPAWISSYISRLGSRTNPPDRNGFRLGLNGAEVTNSHGAETVAWIALEPNNSGLLDGVNFGGLMTTDTVRGYDNGCYNFSHLPSFASAPLVLASQQEMDDTDGAWAQICANNNLQVGLQADEDQNLDAERNHQTETLGFISFKQAFSYGPNGSGGNYATDGWLQSSAFNIGQPAKIQVIEWLSVLPNESALIKLQLRGALDAGGQPGSWSPWYGASGVNSYFTAGAGTLISRDLNGYQWLQYRAELAGDGSETPLLKEIKINYK